MYKQWSTADNKSFFPVREIVKNLPPGHYTTSVAMDGTPIFSKRDVKTENLIKLPNDNSERVIEEIEKFWNMEESFKKHEIPYKRGIILYGPPGSGKTSLIKMIGDDLINNRDGIIIEYDNAYSFPKVYECIREIHPKMPLIFLMEDLDSIAQRDSQTQLLNILDGLTKIDKTIFLATTNYPENLGSRFMNRPSRFDKKIFIGMPSEAAREAYIKTKLLQDDKQIIAKWVKDTEGMSLAHIKELHIANRILGEEYEEAVSTLRKMRECPHSETFDDYTVKKKSEIAYAELKEAYYEDCNKAKNYLRYKKHLQDQGVVFEDKRIRKIAEMITEDIRPIR